MSSSSLPPEIILKILSLLPGKTLTKLRLVSKQFNSLISEPYFLHLHHHLALKSFSTLTTLSPFRATQVVDLNLFLFTKPYKNSLAALPTSLVVESNPEKTQKHITKRFLGKSVRVLASNNQFLCFVLDKEQFLFDPITHKTLEIPNSSSFSSSSSSPNVVSFGFVSSTLQYKIVRFLLPYNPICKFEILTITITSKNYKHHLEISPWISQEQECPYNLQPYRTVHANGSLYWTTKDVPTKIVSFSLEHAKFSVLPPPPCFEDNPSHDFGLCGIRNNLWVVDYNSLAPNIEIWMMDGHAWIKTHRIGLKDSLIRYCRSLPIRIHDIQCDCVLFQVLFPSRMKIYYTRKNEVEDFGELNEELQFCHYTDGLLSL